MSLDLTNPIYHDEEAARKDLESIRWPNGPFCPHCGSFDRVVPFGGKSMGAGWYHCNECRKKFTVTVDTIFERSKIPLHKWRFAFQLMNSSKKGISSHQLMRMLNVTYQTAWFMSHRIRLAMTPTTASPIGGQNKVVETDETYVGGKARNRKNHVPTKQAVVSLVERGGEIRSYHVANVTAETLRPIMVKIASRKSYLMTDESTVYPTIGGEFSGHGTVNHSAQEYVRGVFWHTNTVENAFSIFKRGITGTYHHISEAHLHRYLGEFDFRRNYRSGLGYNDDARTIIAIKGAEGKRLMYRQPRKTAHA